MLKTKGKHNPNLNKHVNREIEKSKAYKKVKTEAHDIK